MGDKILSALGFICNNIMPGKKVVQKLIYLMERKGIELGLDYRIHFYGPYSSELDQLLHAYEAENLIDIDTSEYTHKIKVQGKCDCTALTNDECIIASQIVERYAKKTPLELEVLTTTDFVACDLTSSGQFTQDSVIKGVKRIKGSKFSEQEIQESINELIAYGFILNF